MHEDDMGPTWFFFLVIFTAFVSSDKKISNSKNFVHVGFCGPKVSTKF